MKRHLTILCITLISLLNFIIVSSIYALPIIDGKFDTSEGYTTGYTLKLNVESGKGKKRGKGKSKTTVSGGEGDLWINQDTTSGDISLAFIQPLSLVDNSYGDNSIGWGSDAPSGKNHNYEDLTESDKAQFVFTDGNDNTVLDIVLDYAHEFSGGAVASSVTEGDGKVNTGLSSDVMATASSLEYNYNIYGSSNTELFGDGSSSPLTGSDTTYDVEDADLADWVFASVYELRVDGRVFSENGFGDVEIAVVHNSPNKIAKNKVYTQISGEIEVYVDMNEESDASSPVPEPTTIALLGIGFAWAVVRRRQKQKKMN
ncbi:type IIA topoisomerase (DNA gyrase/topo II, topoisomerase IV), A subunit [Candidatus Scalindua japonica]|uniref:Type IIA topoisomerase (DNA gyrase/topo II, topoisomerase IV), A subunit n=1 Tax=Candidatus Scalindua japonica TaxID=1284222 RepID=A0A286U1S8_9BACT|nr:PEP-CTERM sorting domain-containing protein [Candidatus Scalindua japonica]GAX62099.1 type IIA topoisomerase (DNA gyrase/topo II, topoisomerase IV), A subunit [Candidatus Scalindua japonica]